MSGGTVGARGGAVWGGGLALVLPSDPYHPRPTIADLVRVFLWRDALSGETVGARGGAVWGGGLALALRWGLCLWFGLPSRRGLCLWSG